MGSIKPHQDAMACCDQGDAALLSGDLDSAASHFAEAARLEEEALAALPLVSSPQSRVILSGSAAWCHINAADALSGTSALTHLAAARRLALEQKRSGHPLQNTLEEVILACDDRVSRLLSDPR